MIFHGCRNGNFLMKKFGIFLIFAQNIDCGYMLELPIQYTVIFSAAKMIILEVENLVLFPIFA